MIKQHRLQWLSTWLSIACAVHCLAMPIFLVVASAWGFANFSHTHFDYVLLPLVTLIGVYSLLRDVKLHKNKLPFTLFFIGLIGMILGLAFHHHLLTGVSGFVLAGAQFYNYKLHKQVCKHR